MHTFVSPLHLTEKIYPQYQKFHKKKSLHFLLALAEPHNTQQMCDFCFISNKLSTHLFSFDFVLELPWPIKDTTSLIISHT